MNDNPFDWKEKDLPHWLSVDTERDKRFKNIVDKVLSGYYGPIDDVQYIVTENMLFILVSAEGLEDANE